MTAGSVAHSYSMNAIDSNFQIAAVNSLRHCRARPGNPSSSKMVLRRLMDARVKPGHDKCRHPDSRHTVAPSRREASEALLNLPPERGRGERRVPVAPAASRALCIGKKHTSKRVHRNHPTFPHAMVLTAYVELSPVTGLFCHRRQRICLV